jgi:hypothetical protein
LRALGRLGRAAKSPDGPTAYLLLAFLVGLRRALVALPRAWTLGFFAEAFRAGAFFLRARFRLAGAWPESVLAKNHSWPPRSRAEYSRTP